MTVSEDDTDREIHDGPKSELSKKLYAEEQQEHQAVIGEAERRNMEASIDE